MWDIRYRKKTIRAWLSIEFITVKEIIFVIIAGITLALILTALADREWEMIVAALLPGLISYLLLRSTLISSKATYLIRDYGPILINHPEYTVSDYSRAVRRDTDTVVKELKLLCKKRMLFGQFNLSCSMFTPDEDYNLSALLKHKSWDSAVFR